jgi:hypothetical protein
MGDDDCPDRQKRPGRRLGTRHIGQSAVRRGLPIPAARSTLVGARTLVVHTALTQLGWRGHRRSTHARADGAPPARRPARTSERGSRSGAPRVQWPEEVVLREARGRQRQGDVTAIECSQPRCGCSETPPARGPSAPTNGSCHPGGSSLSLTGHHVTRPCSAGWDRSLQRGAAG